MTVSPRWVTTVGRKIGRVVPRRAGIPGRTSAESPARPQPRSPAGPGQTHCRAATPTPNEHWGQVARACSWPARSDGVRGPQLQGGRPRAARKHGQQRAIVGRRRGRLERHHEPLAVGVQRDGLDGAANAAKNSPATAERCIKKVSRDGPRLPRAGRRPYRTDGLVASGVLAKSCTAANWTAPRLQCLAGSPHLVNTMPPGPAYERMSARTLAPVRALQDVQHVDPRAAQGRQQQQLAVGPEHQGLLPGVRQDAVRAPSVRSAGQDTPPRPSARRDPDLAGPFRHRPHGGGPVVCIPEPQLARPGGGAQRDSAAA